MGFFAVCFFDKKIRGSFGKKLTQRNVQKENKCSEALIQVFRVLVLPLFVCQKIRLGSMLIDMSYTCIIIYWGDVPQYTCGSCETVKHGTTDRLTTSEGLKFESKKHQKTDLFGLKLDTPNGGSRSICVLHIS